MEESMQVDVPSVEPDCLTNSYPVLENAILDLESYIKPYEGYAKLNKLLFIINNSSTLKMEAFQLALDIVQKTYNTNLYWELHKNLKEFLNLTPNTSKTSIPPPDNTWSAVTNRKAELKLNVLDAELKNYKDNSIKESIRRGNDELAAHYFDMGDLNNSLKCYLRTRDYCTSSKHILNMCLNVVRVGCFTRNWQQVGNHVQKAELAIRRSEGDDLVLTTKVKCAAGLYDLVMGKYRPAARNFLQASFENFKYTELLTVNDVVIYATLCSLATLDRQELRKNLFGLSFKMFFESEPILRKIVDMFHQCKYHSFFTLLEKIKDNLLLDNFLAPHVQPLYMLIRKKALSQYFRPYLSVDMHDMAEAFNTNVKDLEDELMQLILEGQINARIDSHNKVVYTKNIDQRSSTYEKALTFLHEYQRKTLGVILRAAFAKRHLLVSNTNEPCPDPVIQDVRLGQYTPCLEYGG